MNQIEGLVDAIRAFVRDGHTVDESARRLILIGAGEEPIRRAVEQYREQANRIRTYRVPRTLVDPATGEGWYLGPDEDRDRFWPPLKAYWLEKKDWRDDVVQSIDEASTKVVSLLSHPGAGTIRTRGLVLGFVQSGKTANYTAVIAKAADAGYRFFVVLSGMTNSLRKQTQLRLQKELQSLNPEVWIAKTTPDNDFGDDQDQNVNAFLTQHATQKTICVVKKHSGRMRYLLEWLAGATDEVLAACPILVIDDEADQASVNTAGNPDERTRINKLLIELLSVGPKVAYVGYTATPFANVFVDPIEERDLYPSDFIVDLPRPDDYFGSEQLFGRERLSPEDPEDVENGYDMIRTVADDEVALLQPPSRDERFAFYPAVTPSLRSALQYFWLATAARRLRDGTAKHSSMLVHTTNYAISQSRLKDPIERERDSFVTRLQEQDDQLRRTLEDLWAAESGWVHAADFGRTVIPFGSILPVAREVAASTEVIVENSTSDQRLFYPDPGGSEYEAKTFVAIGGNVLSRGLTLEGLMVSLFIRNASAYDTLLQMGRWFGFRPNYEDLPRIWMTGELEEYFADLATVEHEIRKDIARYELEHLTPLEASVRVRTHPKLAITSRLKMQRTVEAKVSFSGRAVQTTFFKHQDQDWLLGNLEAGRKLISEATGGGEIAKFLKGPSRFRIRGLQPDIVLDFLEHYMVHERHTEFQNDLLRGYIEEQLEKGELVDFNLAVIGRQGDFELGPGVSVKPLTRSKFVRGIPEPDVANLKAIMSIADSVADLDHAGRLAAEHRKWEKLIDLRTKRLKRTALLALYPVDRNSVPQRVASSATSRRAPLEAVEHVLGIAFVFPESDDPGGQSYLTVDLSRLDREILLDEDLDQ